MTYLGPKFNDMNQCPYGRQRETSHTHGAEACGDGGGTWSHVAISKGTLVSPITGRGS